MIDVGQLGRQLVKSVVILNEKDVGMKRMEKTLQCLTSVAENNMPLNQPIAKSIFYNVVSHYHVYAGKKISEIELISPNRQNDVVDQQLLILFCTTLQVIIKKYSKLLNVYENQDSLVVLLSTCLNESKKRQKQLLYHNLVLILQLVELVKERGRQLIERILPSTVSVLFNIVVEDKMQKKMKQTAMAAITLAIDCYFGGQPSPKSPFFITVQNKLKQYLQLLIDNVSKLPNIQNFCNMLFTHKIHAILAPLCHLSVINDIKLQLPSQYSQCTISAYFKQQIRNSVKTLRGNISTEKKCNLLTFIEKSLHYVQFRREQEKQFVGDLMECLKPSFDQKVRLNIQNQIISIEPDQVFHNQKHESLKSEYQSVRINMLLNTFKFFQQNSQIVKKFQRIFKNSQISLEQQLQQVPYDISMPVPTLLKYTSLLYLISLTQPSTTIFNIIRKSQPVCILKPTTEQQQLILCLSLQIVIKCYKKQQPLPMNNNKIQTLQTLFLLLCQNIYSVRLLCIKQLLYMSIPFTVAECLIAYIPTLINRNKMNIEFITEVVRLTVSRISNGVAHKIVKQYYALKYTQEMMMLLVSKIPSDMARKCILRVTSSSGWIQALFKCARYLSKVSMKQMNNDTAFSTNDKENVVISDSLGVIVLEIGEKWKGELRGKRVGRVLELMNHLHDINPEMVFFKRLKEMFPIFIEILDDFTSYSDSYSKLLVIDKLTQVLTKCKDIVELRESLERVDKAIIIQPDVEHRKKKEEVKGRIKKLLDPLIK